MPKLCLKRRHQRQQDLSQCWLDFPADLLTRDAAARMVSDEDIRQVSSEPSSPTIDGQNSSVNRLRRRSSSMKLSELASSPSFNESDDSIKLAPRRYNTEYQPGSQPNSPSPWGHFVDMLCPSTVSDEGMPFTQMHDLSLCETSFVPGCPSPRSQFRQNPRQFHPYKLSSRVKSTRFPVYTQSAPANELKGFLLRVPDESTGGLLQEAEDAFLGLSL
jgi:hypothetical protein